MKGREYNISFNSIVDHRNIRSTCFCPVLQ